MRKSQTDRLQPSCLRDPVQGKQTTAEIPEQVLRVTQRWSFPSKQNSLDGDEPLTARVKDLWEANVSQKEMLRVLNDEGFAVTERELMRLRGKNRWLLHTANGEGVTEPSGVGAVNNGTSTKNTRRQQLDQQSDGLPVEPSREVLAKRQEVLQKRQADSDERWASRKRRRRTRGWGGLPADPQGPPRFPSETTLDESKVVLRMDNDVYRRVRDQFQAICEEEGVIKKTIAGPEKWQQVKDRLVKENEHLQNVVHNDSSESLQQKYLSIDVICLDVTKRMRVVQTRVTIADAKNVLRINPEESRQLRATFFAKLKDENFVNKTDLGQDRWNQLKGEWIAESALLQRILDPGDPEHQEKLKAVEMLCRDVMKRLRDDLARRDPHRQKQAKGPGPGPAPPRPSAPKNTGSARRTFQPSYRTSAAEPLSSDLFTSNDLQIDPSLLLAASDALPHTLQADDADSGYPSNVGQQSSHLVAPPTYPAHHAASVGVWLRLHPHSTWQAEPKLWLGTLVAGTHVEVRQQVLDEHPGAQITRISGIVKDSTTGAEVSYLIDDDARLSGYLAHVSGGDALFEVHLAPA